MTANAGSSRAHWFFVSGQMKEKVIGIDNFKLLKASKLHFIKISKG